LNYADNNGNKHVKKNAMPKAIASVMSYLQWGLHRSIDPMGK
jgi:hypothetical protein